MKQNCWEFTKCGREQGGAKAAESGTCPASIDTSLNGLNGGENGGRICWSVVGSLSNKYPWDCGNGKTACSSCGFYKLVEKEEGIGNFLFITP